MGIFGWKKSKVPEWASFLSEKQYETFANAIDDYFRKKLKLSYEIHDGAMIFPENELGLQQLGLGNLAQLCRQNRLESYHEIIESHFDSMVQTYRFQNEFKKIEKDYDQIEKYLAVRLYDEEYLSAIGDDGVVGKVFAGELVSVLVFDLPHSIINVQPEQIKYWGKTEDQLLEIGLANIRKNYIINIETLEIGPEKDTLFSCEANHFFVANVMFDLETRDGFVGPYGSLIAVPNRSLAIVYPIKDMKVINMINNLCGMVSGIFNDNPGSLTKEIYWYRNSSFHLLPYKIEKKKLQFTPPDEFVELLNSIVEDSK